MRCLTREAEPTPVTHKIAKRLVDHSSQYDCHGLSPLSLHPTYSGRWMFGHPTAAVSGNLQTLLVAVAELVREDPDEADEIIRAMRDLKMDSLGLDTIFY